MDRFTRQELESLLELEGEQNVSLLMPAIRAGRETQQNATRFKNLVKQATKQLSHSDENGTWKKVLAELESRADEQSFWEHRSDGLAVFVSPAGSRSFWVPLTLPEKVFVGSRFLLRPLMPMLQDDGQFYVLAASQKSIRLLRCTHYEANELHPENLPHDLRSALNIDEYVDSLQQHSTGDFANQNGSGHVHGQGASDLDIRKKDEIQQFFYRVSDALADHLGDSRVPLVFAGVEYLFPLFERASDYKGLVREAVKGNFDIASPEEIRAEAWKIMQPHFHRLQEEAVSAYRDKTGTDWITDDLGEVVVAARNGLVDTLFVRDGAEAWGRVTDAGVEQSDQRQNDSIDLLNEAVAHTFLNSGRVLTLPEGEMPSSSIVAAHLRTPISLRQQHQDV